MNITMIGTGYVGLIAGLGFAKWGNEVVCLDVIQEKVDLLNQGICPIYEPGAIVQLQDGLSSGRLRFTCDTKMAIEHGEVIFIAVGTPEAPDGSADMKYYLSHGGEVPVMGITPDGEYPVINGEKGLVTQFFTCELQQRGSVRLQKLTGGMAHNIVPAHACAWLLCPEETAGKL